MNYQYHIYIKDMEQPTPIIITDEHGCDEDAILHGEHLYTENASFDLVNVYKHDSQLKFLRYFGKL
ncbi:hypothetical protein [Paenibacillus larvae]|uniref:Uncharacterized protein n=1 Tax=Paenibacillus larvae subsp. larvae TaxID=147375 RepID=A0A6C0QXZ5_9BACL|nr:hypothetical protein [Paenibacillus larvae]QHZ53391.1 hypothetical protein ERICV_04340 [Paenibacillus larvae subsp. larvae]